MTRILLTDGSGGWFDEDTAIAFEEDTYWNGNNHISRATGSQWEHEKLYRTKSGKWVLSSWSQWQGSGPTQYVQIEDGDAAAWLLGHGHCDRLSGLDEQTRVFVEEYVATQEV